MSHAAAAAARTFVDAAGASDEDLVRRSWDGDETALAALLDRYRGFVRTKARSYFLIGGDREDVVQEGMVGLYKAVRDFDPEQQVSFRGFAELCVVRQIITAIKMATRQKHSPLNSYVSLHVRVHDADGDSELADQVVDDTDDPVERVIRTDEVAVLRHQLGQILSELESEVLERYLQGQTYAEIAAALQRQVKSIDNALQRIKRKIDAFLAERAASD